MRWANKFKLIWNQLTSWNFISMSFWNIKLIILTELVRCKWSNPHQVTTARGNSNVTKKKVNRVLFTRQFNRNKQNQKSNKLKRKHTNNKLVIDVVALRWEISTWLYDSGSTQLSKVFTPGTLASKRAWISRNVWYWCVITCLIIIYVIFLVYSDFEWKVRANRDTYDYFIQQLTAFHVQQMAYSARCLSYLLGVYR